MPQEEVSDCSSSELTEAERLVEQYLNSFDGKTSFTRSTCCNSSRSLYCKECCRLLVPDNALPHPIYLRRNNGVVDGHSVDESSSTVHGEKPQRPLMLPFNLHIILDDRRGSATGLHAVALLNNEGEMSTQPKDNVVLIDVANGGNVPNYSRCDQSCTSVNDNSTTTTTNHEQSDTTFLLFPSPGESVPIESVACQMETLVVLDCKWTKSSLYRKNANLSKLKKVHLTKPPSNTYYWRWHNAGSGCVSTIEAIFYAAMEVSQLKQKSKNQCASIEDNLAERNNLIHLLWLFGQQRAATFKAAERDGIPAPGSEQGKELARSLRKQKGEYAWRSERNIEVGKILKEECRKMKVFALTAKESKE